MAQVRRPAHYRSPPARQIPRLPNPIRIQPPDRIKIHRRSQSLHGKTNDNQSLLSLASSSENKNSNIEESQLFEDGIFRKRHLPVYAQFPFNPSFLPQPMDINVEDNIHKLRLRLIDSELKHQRRSTDEYIKRTQRFGMENDLSNSERDFDLRRFQESISQRRRSTHAHDTRLILQPLTEESVYTTTNIDDLIDSMARRHLAHRRLDYAIDRQRRNHAYQSGSYAEMLGTGRRSARNEESMPTGRSSRNYTDRDIQHMLRSRIDYYNRIHPDHDNFTSQPKLPPISPGFNTNRSNQFNRTLKQSEELIALPSDIYLSSRSNQNLQLTHQLSNENSNNHNGFFTEPFTQQKKRMKFGGNRLKKVSLGIVFFMILKHQANRNRPNRLPRSASAAIHKIRLQEIIVGLHRVYLEPDGPIFNALIQSISQPIPLEHALDQSSKNYSDAIKIIGIALKNIMSKLLDFMPKDGVLGTGKNSAISALIQDGNTFPEKYFWECERECLQFNRLKIVNITKQRAILLLIGVFIFRGLVTTLLIKPVKYRLILGQLSPKQAIALKILASTILYIGRRVAGEPFHPLSLPHEWQLSLYSDVDIQPIIQHSEIRSIIDLCEQSLRMWCEEYIRRIDNSFDRELRS